MRMRSKKESNNELRPIKQPPSKKKNGKPRRRRRRVMNKSRPTEKNFRKRTEKRKMKN